MDVIGTLGPQSPWDLIVCQSSNSLITNLSHNKIQNGDISSNNASTDTLSLPLSGPTGTVRLVPLLAQEPNTGVGKNALTHWESCLSFPPEMRKRYPANSSPRVAPSISW